MLFLIQLILKCGISQVWGQMFVGLCLLAAFLFCCFLRLFFFCVCVFVFLNNNSWRKKIVILICNWLIHF